MALTKPRGVMLDSPKLATKQASTSGTSIDFTGIPAGTKRITVMLAGVSTNGTDSLVLQIGDSGGVEATGYSAGIVYGQSASSPLYGVAASTTFWAVGVRANADNLHDGVLTLTLMDAATNTWALSGTCFGYSGTTPYYVTVSGSKALSGTLDRVRLTTNGGTGTFDAGTVNIAYE